MRKRATRMAIGLLLALIALVPLSPATGQQPSMPLACEEFAFSTEEDFWTHGPQPDEGPYISDGDLLSTNNLVCARNLDLVGHFNVIADLGLDAADVIDAEAFLVAFSTELDSPDAGQFTSGDMLTTNGVIIPNVALTYSVQSSEKEDLGLDALHFVGEKRAIVAFLNDIQDSQLGRSYWLEQPDKLSDWLEEYEIDIWFSTEGTWMPIGAVGFLDGDLLSAGNGTIVADNEELLAPGVPADVRDDGVDFGLDAVTASRTGDKEQIRFSTEILYQNKLSFTDGDVLDYDNGIAYTNQYLIQSFEPMADFLGLDAFHSVVVEQLLGDVYLPIVLRALGERAQ